MGRSYARFRAGTDTAVQQLHLYRVPHHSLEHGLIPVVAALAPPGVGLMVAVTHYGTPAFPLAAEHLDMDDVALSFQRPCPGKTVQHVGQEGVDIG